VFLVMRSVDTGDYVMEALQWRVRARDAHVTRAERRTTVQRLRSMRAEASQDDVLDYLHRHHVPGVRSFWISNAVYVPDAPAELVATLARRADVLRVRANRVAAKLDPLVPPASLPARARVPSATGGQLLEWNIAQIAADVAWATTRGEGVVVANIDSGVRQTHEAVRATYRGYQGANGTTVHDYNWFDPKEFARDPWWCDPSWPLPDECRTDDPFDNTGHVRRPVAHAAPCLSVRTGRSCVFVCVCVCVCVRGHTRWVRWRARPRAALAWRPAHAGLRPRGAATAAASTMA
jgi:subtilisin family serine protease